MQEPSVENQALCFAAKQVYHHARRHENEKSRIKTGGIVEGSGL